MTLLAPEALLLGVAVTALAVAYLVVQRRRPRYALRFTSVDLLASVAPRRPGWRRHLTAAVFLAGLAALVLALARPTVPLPVPRERATVVVAVDVSLSMAATDVEPTRLEAAQAAAREFARELPERFRLGLVAYAGTATVLVPPVTDRDRVVRALDGLRLDESTATGEAVLAALAAVEAVPGEPGQEPPPARVVVLSDGETTVGRSEAVAAQAAVAAGVPVSTIAFGTDAGTVEVEGQVVGVPVDRHALAELARATGGQAYEARDAGELARAYDEIGSSVGTVVEPREVTVPVAAGALGLFLLAGTLSLLWAPRLP